MIAATAAEAELDRRALKIMGRDSIDYLQACSKAQTEDPSLYEKYLKEKEAIDEYKQVHAGCTEGKSYPIHEEQDGSFHLDSCDSHGGCIAAQGIIYCPYCGRLLDRLSPES